MDAAATDAADLAATCLISTCVRHRLATVTMREAALGWVQSGRKTLFGPHGALRIDSGQSFVAARGSQWDVENDPAGSSAYRAQIFVFTPSLLALFSQQYAATCAAVPPLPAAAMLPIDDELQEALQRTAKLLQGGSPTPTLHRHRLLEVLLLLAARGVTWSSAPWRWDEQVRHLIGQRPHGDWSVATLAAAFHTSPSTLRRRLQQCDTSVGEVVREVRLETALALLQSTSLAVGDIAARCGYDSHSRFSAAFRARYGFAPSHLRPGALNGSAQ